MVQVLHNRTRCLLQRAVYSIRIKKPSFRSVLTGALSINIDSLSVQWYVFAMKYDLTEFGLDEAEAAVYSAFLEIGTATVSEVTKAAGITRTLGYHVIDKLIKKGLVDGVLSESKKLYRANHPRSLSNYVKKREKEWQRKSERTIPFVFWCL